jgi:hypothetical protein
MTLFHPAKVHWARDAANGMYPAVQLYGRAVATENYLTRRQKKVWAARSWRLGSGTGGVSGTTNLFRFRRRSSIGVTRLQLLLMMGKTLGTGAPSTPSPAVEIDVKISGGATTTVGPIYYGLTTVTPTDAPEEWYVAQREIAIDPATVYECLVKTLDYGRLLGLGVRELGEPTISEATDYYNLFVAQADAPLYDATRERLIRGLSEMYRWNAGGGIDWGRDSGAARTRTSATYANLYDGTTTGTPTAATRGFHLDNTYRHTLRRTTVPYEIGIWASMASGTGNVKLMDTAGNSYGPVAINSATPGWFVGTVNLPNDGRKFDLQYAGDGANQISVFQVSIAEWEDL